MSGTDEYNLNNNTTGLMLTTGDGCHINVNGNITTSTNNSPKKSREKGTVNELRVPRSINCFVGRNKDIQLLENELLTQPQKRVLIYGLPGMGKTELAKHVGKKLLKDKKIQKFIWIDAEKEVDIIKSFQDLKKNCENIKDADNRTLIKLIYEYYKNYTCLFVFDNCESQNILFEYEPPNINTNYYCLITSHHKDWGHIRSYELIPLQNDFAVKVYKAIFTNKLCENEDKLLEKLANMYDNIPLSIQITGSYIRQQINIDKKDFKLQAYIEELQKSQEQYFDTPNLNSSDNTYNKSLYSAVVILINKMKKETFIRYTESILKPLGMISYLNPDYIYFNDILEMLKLDDPTTKEVFYILNKFAFEKISKEDNRQIKIHKCIQTIIRMYMNKENLPIKDNIYQTCLKYSLFKKIVHISTTLKFADDHLDTFFNFYKENKSDLLKKEKFEISLTNTEIESAETNTDVMKTSISKLLLTNLVSVGCIKSLKKLFIDVGKSRIKDYIIEFYLLHYSVLYNQIQILKCLLEYKIDVNSLSAKKDTSLHLAAFTLNSEAIRILRSNDANLSLKNSTGLTAYNILFKSYSHRKDLEECPENLEDMLTMLYHETNETSEVKKTSFFRQFSKYNQ